MGLRWKLDVLLVAWVLSFTSCAGPPTISDLGFPAPDDVPQSATGIPSSALDNSQPAIGNPQVALGILGPAIGTPEAALGMPQPAIDTPQPAVIPADLPAGPQPSSPDLTTRQAEPCEPLPIASRATRPVYRFQVVAAPPTHRLQVEQQLALADPIRLAMGEILFNVPANHAPGIFNLTNVRLAGRNTSPDVQLSETALRIGLPDEVRGAPAITLCLDYTLELPPAAEAGLSSIHALNWSELGLVAGYWYPVLAPYDPARGWVLTPYHPVGDPIVFETAEYAVDIRAPAGYTVIGAGLTETNGGVWRFQVPNARGFAFDVTDRLVATEGAVAGIPIRVYHLPEHQVAASDVLRAVAEAIPLFMAAYGPYPYTGLTIVEAVQFGGMEYSGLITFSSQAFTDYKPPDPDAEFGAHFLIKFVVHEIGHQWWYGAVGNDQAHEPWLDEALARYGEWLYYSQLHPRDLAWWEAPSAGMATLPINQPIYNFTDTSGYVQAIYVSGARFLLALREQMGDEAFSAFLREYYAQNRDRIVSQSEFLSLLRAYAGPDVEGLLAVYFSPPP